MNSLHVLWRQAQRLARSVRWAGEKGDAGRQLMIAHGQIGGRVAEEVLIGQRRLLDRHVSRCRDDGRRRQFTRQGEYGRGLAATPNNGNSWS